MIKAVVLNNQENQLSVIYKSEWNGKDIYLYEASYDACIRWCEKRNWIWTQE